MCVPQSHELCGDLRGVVHPAGKVLLVTAASRSDAATLKAGLEGNPAALKVLREYSQAHRTQEQGGPSRSGPPAAKKGERLVLRPLTALTAPDLRKRRGRVIVRNLSFEATERNVADKLGRFGPLVSVEVPKVAKAEAAGAAAAAKMRPRGFAFVTVRTDRALFKTDYPVALTYPNLPFLSRSLALPPVPLRARRGGGSEGESRVGGGPP